MVYIATLLHLEGPDITTCVCSIPIYLCLGGTTVDIGDNLLPSLTVFGCSLTAVEVETGPLSDVVFPSFHMPPSFP